MDRCWLQGAVGDALHALGCAAGYNIRWLLRAITRLGLKGLFCVLSAMALWVLWLVGVASNLFRTARVTATHVVGSRRCTAPGTATTMMRCRPSVK
jgi:hypothetical protein